MSSLTPEDVDAVCGLVDDLCGIYWDEEKSYLIESRLASLVEENNCENYAALVRKVRADVVPGLKDSVVDAVTTNETLWFRDNSPFEAIRHKAIPEVIDERSQTIFPKKIRIWSAACSTGQEPYSIGIALADVIPDVDSWDIQILATDISPSAVEKASRGVYSKLEIGRGMDTSHLRDYFVEQEDSWKIHDRIRAMCKFDVRNLLKPFSGLDKFDIIFCRNVAIYFTGEDRRSLFERLADSLAAPYGWLFTGSSESLSDLGDRWSPQQHCRSNCYRPNLVEATMA